MLEKKRKKRRQSLQRGQALVEYSAISHALLIGGVAIGWPFFTIFINALNKYYEDLFTVLTSPLP
jgi:hypothetical protein